MKAIVDQDTCIGCGICENICPEVFKMNGNKVTVIQKPVSAENFASSKTAWSDCPVSAITLT